MKIVVDTREHEFIQICREKIQEYPHITLEIAQLDLGDMEIHYKDQKLLVWERKTFQDLLSSIKDGRYAEQSHRLLHEYRPNQVVYLIEGIFSHLKNDMEKKTALSAMTTLGFFKGVHLWRSVHVQDSVHQILACCDKIYREYERGNTFISNKEEKQEQDPPVSYSHFVKKVKKDNITPENIGEIFLCQLPGINTNTAQALMAKADGDFSQLMDMIKNNPEELHNTFIGADKPRRIAKSTVAQLKLFLGQSDLKK
jgi:ERCC4-type nuclease